ncbi:tudor domain-containing protein 5 [Rhinophrynus dorsalis]
MDEERIMQGVQKHVRSLLIASKKGLSIQELEQDYRMMIGSHLPVRALGYRSTMELLLDMPNVVQISSQFDGTVRLTAVVDEATRGIAELVARQKDNSGSKVRRRQHIFTPRCHTALARRGRIAPVLPASVKSDLRDLLSISPLLLSELEKSFLHRFGRQFQYTRYGFYSMLEVLRSVSDIVQVKQTRAGSLLVLRNSETGETSNASGTNGHQNSVSQPCPPAAYSKVPSCVPGQSSALTQIPEKKISIQKNPLTTVLPLMQSNDKQTGPISLVKSSSVKNSTFDKQAQNVEAKVPLQQSVVSAEDISPGKSPSSPARSQNVVKNSCLIKQPRLVETPEIPKSAPNKEQKPDTVPDTETCLQWLEKKLETELRLCIARKGAGAVISPDMKRDIKHVVKQHSEGLLLSQLSVVFKAYTGKALPYKELGFMSVMELVGSLVDMLHLEVTPDGQDWRLFDAESKHIAEVTSEHLPSTDRTVFNWKSPHQQPIHVKPVGTKLSLADEKLWWGPLELQQCYQQYDIPPDAVLNQKLHCLPSMKRGFMIGVFVENNKSPSQFYVRCCGKDTSQKLEDMMLEMRRCYSSECVSERYLVPDQYVSVGEIYALRVSGDVWWYRVIVHAVLGSEALDVFYPDFGNVATVKRSWLRFLKTCYMKLPAQAVPSCLAYVRPVEDQWSIQAIKRFQQLCACGPLVGVVLQYVENVLYLFLCDTSTEEDLYLHQLLITQGLALMGEDPRFCKPLIEFKELESQQWVKSESLKFHGTMPPWYQQCHNLCLLQTSQKSSQLASYLTKYPEQSQEESPESPENNENSEVDFSFEKKSDFLGKEELELGTPYIQAVPPGTDVWDESWPFLDRAVSLNDTSKPSHLYTETPLEENQSQEPVMEQDDDGAGQLSGPLEEFYISLIKSKKPQGSNDIQQSPPRSEQPKTEVVEEQAQGGCFPSILGDKDINEENPDYCLSGEPIFYQQSSSYGINPLLGFQKLQIGRSATTVALGAAARLATAGSILYWVPDSGKVNFEATGARSAITMVIWSEQLSTHSSKVPIIQCGSSYLHKSPRKEPEAYKNQASVKHLCKVVKWSSLHSFIKYYHVNVLASVKTVFDQKVLQAVVRV